MMKHRKSVPLMAGLVASAVMGIAAMGNESARAGEDQTLSSYDRQSMDLLFQQAMSTPGGLTDDDMLTTGSIGRSKVASDSQTKQRPRDMDLNK
ncbi:MAG: hypothetical protein ACJAVO_000450 [Parvibaculaceae bacterium]|jgi:hypothetical protein|nr:hypothetical protein [Parvibaculaceae bacterium]